MSSDLKTKNLIKELIKQALKKTLKEQWEKEPDLFGPQRVSFEKLQTNSDGLFNWFSFSNPRELPLTRLMQTIKSMNLKHDGMKRDITPQGGVEYKLFNVSKAEVAKLLSSLPEGIKYRAQETRSSAPVDVQFNRMNSRRTEVSSFGEPNEEMQSEPTIGLDKPELERHKFWKKDSLPPQGTFEKPLVGSSPQDSNRLIQQKGVKRADSYDKLLSSPPGEYTKPAFQSTNLGRKENPFAGATNKPVDIDSEYGGSTPRPYDKPFDIDDELMSIYKMK